MVSSVYLRLLILLLAILIPDCTSSSPAFLVICYLPERVSCGVIAPFFWVLRHKVLLCPPRVYFPVRCKFWQLYSRVKGNILQEGLYHTQVCCTQSPWPYSRPTPTGTSTGDTHSSSSVSVGSLGPGVHKVCFRPLIISGRNGVWFKMWINPSYHLAAHGVIKARILDWFAIPFSSGPHPVRPLHYDPSILGDPTGHGLVSLS